MHLFPRNAKEKAGLVRSPQVNTANTSSSLVPLGSTVDASRTRSPSRNVQLSTVSRQDPLKRHIRDLARKRAGNTVAADRSKQDEGKDLLDSCAPYTESYNHYLRQVGKRNKEQVLKVIERMRREHVPLDQTTFNLLLEKVVDLKDDIAFHIYDQFSDESQREDSSVRPDLNTFRLMVRACERNSEHRRAFQLYSQMKEMFGLHPDLSLYNTLIGFCVPLKEESTASGIVEEMRDRGVESDVHTYNSLMAVFSDAPYELILQTFNDMITRKIRPNRRTYNTLMRACQKICDYDKAFQFFEELKKEALVPDVVTYNLLLSMCSERLDYVVGAGRHAHLRRTKEQKEQGMKAVAELSLALFGEMEEGHIKANTYTYNALLAVLGKCSDIRVYELFEHMKRDAMLEAEAVSDYGSSPKGSPKGKTDDTSMPLWVAEANTLDIDKLLQASSLADDDLLTGRVGAKGVHPNLETYSLLIEASHRMGMPDKAYTLFDEMKDNGIRPDKSVYIKMMDVCTIKAEKSRAFAVFEEAQARGQIRDTELFNALINVLAECSDPKIFDIFEEVKGDRHSSSVKPNHDSYNILMKACQKLKNFDQAMSLYKDMCRDDSPIKPDTVTYGLLMDVCALQKNVSVACDLIVDMKRRGVPPTINTYCRLMNVFVEASDSGIVEVFSDIQRHGPQPNLETYTILLGFFYNKREEGILNLFDEMKKANIEPDLHAYNIMLNYCAATRDRRKALKFFEELKVRELNADIETYNAMIAVFAESGDELIFNVFEEMSENNIRPDYVTFSILGKHKNGMQCLRKASEKRLIFVDQQHQRW